MGNVNGYSMLQPHTQQVIVFVIFTTILTIWDTGFPDFKADGKWIYAVMHDNGKVNHIQVYKIRCQMSPDGSKVAITNEARSQTCILEITSGSGKDNITEPIEVVENVYDFAWFPDSKKFAYLQDWTYNRYSGWSSWDVVVQRPASRQSTMIHHSEGFGTTHCRIFVTADGCRLITQDEQSFMTWDVSDL